MFDDGRGDVARIALERFGNLHGDIAGQVAMFSDLGPLKRDGRRQAGAGNEGLYGGADQGGDVLDMFRKHERSTPPENGAHQEIRAKNRQKTAKDRQL